MIQINKNSSTKDKLLDAAFIEVYKYGYNASSTTRILKSINIPKGSMYHHFSSKKELILAVISQRIFPKMNDYFDFTYNKNKSVYDTLDELYIKMSNNDMLITNGCPLHRLMVEMSNIDEDFNKILNKFYKVFTKKISTLLKKGIQIREFEEFDTKIVSEYLINSTWGALSISPCLSSREQFIQNYKIILQVIKNKTI